MLGGNCDPCCGSDTCLAGVETVRVEFLSLPGSCTYSLTNNSSIADDAFVNRSAKTEECSHTLFRIEYYNPTTSGWVQDCAYAGVFTDRFSRGAGQNFGALMRLEPSAERLTLPFIFGYFGPEPGKSFQTLPYEGGLTLLTGNQSKCSAEELASIVVRISSGRGDSVPLSCPQYLYGLTQPEGQRTTCTAADLAPVLPATAPENAISFTGLNISIAHCSSCEEQNFYTQYIASVPRPTHDNGAPCVESTGENGIYCYKNVFIPVGVPELNIAATFSGAFQNLSATYALKFASNWVQGWSGTFYADGPGAKLAIRLAVDVMGYQMEPQSPEDYDFVGYPRGSPVASCGHDSISYVLRGAVYYSTSPYNSFGDYISLQYWDRAFSFYQGTECRPRVCRALPQVAASGSRAVSSTVPGMSGQISFSLSNA